MYFDLPVEKRKTSQKAQLTGDYDKEEQAVASNVKEGNSFDFEYEEVLKRFGAVIKVYRPNGDYPLFNFKPTKDIKTSFYSSTGCKKSQKLIHTTQMFNVSKVETINDIEYEFDNMYFTSIFEDLTSKFKNEVPSEIKNLSQEDILNLSKIADIDVEDIMKLYLSFYVTHNFDFDFEVDLTEVLFGFLYQNYPIGKPSKLFPEKKYKDVIDLRDYLINGMSSFAPNELFYTVFWKSFENEIENDINEHKYLTSEEWYNSIQYSLNAIVKDYFFSHNLWGQYLNILLTDIENNNYVTTKEWVDRIRFLCDNYLTIIIKENNNWDNYLNQLVADILLPKYVDINDWRDYIFTFTGTTLKQGYWDNNWDAFTNDFVSDIMRGMFEHSDDWNQYINNLGIHLVIEIALIESEEQRNIIYQALDKHIINFNSSKETVKGIVEKIIEFFELAKKNINENVNSFDNQVSINDFFDMASTSLDDNAKSEITSMFYGNNADLIEFRKRLLENVEKYGAENVQKTIVTFEVGHISENHSPMIELVKTELENPSPGEAESVRDLAKYPKSIWEAKINSLIISGKQGYPKDTPGETEAEKISNYAESLKLNNEKIYPDVSYIADADRDNEHGLTYFDTIKDFIYTNSEGFDLLIDSVDDKYHPEGTDAEKAEKKNQFKAVQRAFRISPNPRCANALLGSQIHSAGQLYFMGKESVEEVLKGKGISAEDTDVIFKMATSRYANSLAALTNIKGDLMVGEPKAIVPNIDIDIIKSLEKDFPNFKDLFGSLDYCECTHCASVYSASAYLLDVLSFLNSINSKKPKPIGNTKFNVREILSERRGDIESIKLNCTNAETPMPYIDLVNEIFENRLGIPAEQPYQTTLTSKEGLILF